LPLDHLAVNDRPQKRQQKCQPPSCSVPAFSITDSDSPATVDIHKSPHSYDRLLSVYSLVSFLYSTIHRPPDVSSNERRPHSAPTSADPPPPAAEHRRAVKRPLVLLPARHPKSSLCCTLTSLPTRNVYKAFLKLEDKYLASKLTSFASNLSSVPFSLVLACLICVARLCPRVCR
jgi:hypothetical protein